MKKHNAVDVIINTKKYTIGGCESAEYLQRVAAYINSKYDEFRHQENYNSLDAEFKNVLMQINLADDYFKLKEQYAESEKNNEVNMNEIYKLKQEIVNLKAAVSKKEEENEKLKADIVEEQKEIVRLETELGKKKKKETK